MPTRRDLILYVPAAAGVAIAGHADAAPLTRLTESEPIAVSLGYRHVAGQVDRRKHPTFAPGANCANCALFKATRGEAWAGCAVLPNKLVSASGWCIAWSKKA